MRKILFMLVSFLFFILFAGAANAETEREAILNHAHSASWVYFTDSRSAAGSERWYISPVSPSKVGIYSLGPITSGNASWWTVGNNVAAINLGNRQVTVDSNLDTDTSNSFFDLGLNKSVTNSAIHSDRQKIQGSTVAIKWFFFQAPNGSWYIVNAPGYASGTQVLKFSQLNGAYDWKATDTSDLVPVFTASGNGTMGVAFRSATASDDHGNSISRATVIAANSSTAGSIEVAGDNDYFRIDVTGGGTLTLKTTGSTDTYGYLLDQFGGELQSHDDISNADRNFLITQPVLGATTYYVRVKHVYSTGTGSYTLVAQFTPSTPAATKAVLLLHGLNSGPDTWNVLVTDRWGGDCMVIYNGVLPIGANRVDATGAVCYRIKFGAKDLNSANSADRTGLEQRTCGLDARSSSGQGCGGDYTRIFNNGVDDIGVEVKMAVEAIRARWTNSVQVVLVGHSRGGLAARAFLQVPGVNPAISVVGLITTGTPHYGSPLGRMYKRLLDSCILGGIRSKINPGCDEDWKAADQISESLDIRTPAVKFLSPESSDIVQLENTKQVLLSRNIFVRKMAYQDNYLGHLSRVYKFGIYIGKYSAWNRSGSFELGNQFSAQSKSSVLCVPLSCYSSEDSPEMLGDGIVPSLSQAATSISGVIIPFPGGSIFHNEETEQKKDLNAQLNGAGTWR